MTPNTSACYAGEESKVLNRLPELVEPLLRFDLLQELQQLRGEDSWGRETGRSSKTLAKYPDFRIVLILMKANTQMNQHRAEGRISIHQLLGKICVHLADRKVNVSAGELLVLDCGILHNLEALIAQPRSIGRECLPADHLLGERPRRFSWIAWIVRGAPSGRRGFVANG
jgi:quercetin dioxygenase-like cupin family protein